MKRTLRLSHHTTDELIENILVLDYISLAKMLKSGQIVIAPGDEPYWDELLAAFETTMRYYLSNDKVNEIKESLDDN
jgi:hypothetical protein